MLTIQTKATVNSNHTLQISLPDSLPAGEYDVVLVIDTVRETKPQADLHDFPVDDYGFLIAEVPLSREEM
ncbi:MAG: hypothetical protein AAFY78_22165 [Cyanobacteria bacterium J06648_16]